MLLRSILTDLACGVFIAWLFGLLVLIALWMRVLSNGIELPKSLPFKPSQVPFYILAICLLWPYSLVVYVQERRRRKAFMAWCFDSLRATDEQAEACRRAYPELFFEVDDLRARARTAVAAADQEIGDSETFVPAARAAREAVAAYGAESRIVALRAFLTMHLGPISLDEDLLADQPSARCAHHDARAARQW